MTKDKMFQLMPATCSILLILAAASAMLMAPLRASEIEFRSGPAQTSLVELYTSEGCSSCPPADQWLSRQTNAPGLWKDFVPLAFHVDYWNGLGWRDPWSSPQFTERQRDYARAWASDTIYTPEFVRNGMEWSSWQRSKTVPVSSAQTGLLAASSTNGSDWAITFQPASRQDRLEVHAAQLVSELSSDVKAGENRGRRLHQDFVVIKLVEARMERNEQGFEAKILISPPAKAIKGRVAMAIWVTAPGDEKPLQATGGWLPSARQSGTAAEAVITE